MRQLKLSGAGNYGYYPMISSATNLRCQRFADVLLILVPAKMTDRIIAFLILCSMFSLPFGVAVIFTGEVMLNFVSSGLLFMSAFG